MQYLNTQTITDRIHIMKALLSLLVVGATLLTGCAESSATAADVKTITATTQVTESDPAWDCNVDGNKICGANPIERTAAWGSFSTNALSGEVKAKAFTITYRGIANEGIDFPPSQYVTIKSGLTPGKVNVFEIGTLNE
jgi:hypothetical protein